MNHLTKEYVTKLKDSLLFINAVVIIYNASLFQCIIMHEIS